MIAGHVPLAFAIAGLAGTALGYQRRQVLPIAAVAGLFAIVPDVDILHAFLGLATSIPSEPLQVNDVFWAASRELHRGSTHSLVLAIPAVLGFGLLSSDRWPRAAGIVLLATLVAIGFELGSILGVVMMGLYVVVGVGIVALARHLALSVPATTTAAAVGLLTHPFGDLFTGTPPALLYPLSIAVVPERIELHADPTLNLLSVFGLELACIWVGLAVAASLTGETLPDFVEPHAALGLGYGAIAFVLPPPSLDVAVPFVGSVLSVGLLGVPSLLDRTDRKRIVRGAVTGLAAVTFGAIGYSATYVLL